MVSAAPCAACNGLRQIYSPHGGSRPCEACRAKPETPSRIAPEALESAARELTGYYGQTEHQRNEGIRRAAVLLVACAREIRGR